MKKNILALIMAVAMVFTLAIPSFAASEGGGTSELTKYDVFVKAADNGTVETDKLLAAENDLVTLTVSPSTGYALAELNGVEATKINDTTYTFNMPGNGVFITPRFEAVKYSINGPDDITVPSDFPSNASVSISFGKLSDITYQEDITISVSGIPTGYELTTLAYTTTGSDTPVSILGKESFKMPASNITVVAEVSKLKYDVSLNYSSTMGNVTVNSSKAQAGDNVIVNITPVDTARYEVSSVAISVANSDTVPSYDWNSGRTAISFTMPASAVTVQVVFAKKQTAPHTITLNCESKGDADIYVNGSKISSSTIEARWDDVVTIEVDPDSNYMLEKLTVTDADNGNVTIGYDEDMYSFVMPNKNVTIDIDFVSFGSKDKGPYDIYVDSDDGDYTVVVEGGESGLCLETDIAYQGDKVHVYIQPEEGYIVESIDFDGASAYNFDEDENYAWFKMPYDDVEVTITYEFDDEYEGDGDYFIDTSYSSSKGTVSVQDSANEGEKVYITVRPKSGYVLDEIEVIEDTARETSVRVRSSSATKYYFTMPDEDVIVIATFVRDDDWDDDDDDYYDIFVAESDHGEVDVDDEAVSGDTVKIKVDSDYGYTVDEIIVSRANGKIVTVTKKSTYWQFTMPSADVFIEVIYKRGSSSSDNDGDYAIDLYYNDDYGYVDVVDSSNASEKVYIYVEPNDDCEVEDIIITRTNGKVIDYKYNASNDYYYFTMPASDVEIEVTFEGEPSDDDEDEDFDGYYDIILDYDDNAGIVEIDDKAEEGEKVYIELDLESDYTLDKIRAFEYDTGATVTVRKSSSTKYYFTMPENDVFVVITFDSEEYEGDDTYNISVDSNDYDLGSADSSVSKAAKGERVLVFIDPDSEYAVLDIIAVRTNGHTINVSKINNFCYEFTMPGTDVDVTVNFDEDRPLSYKEITLNYDKKMGEVYLSDDFAEEDDDVNIYVDAYNGYKVDSVSVKRTVGNKKVTCSKTKTGDYVFTMPNADVTVTVTFKKIEEEKPVDPKPVDPKPTEPTIHICPAKPFTDVNVNEWYHDAIDYVIAYNLMNGYSATQFAPGDNVSRAMTVTVLWRIAGQPASTAALPYTDVAEGQWYTEAVRWAAANGLLTNVAAGSTFEPNSTITREQFASVIYRYEKLIGNGYTNGWTHPLKFSDLNLMSAWALEPLTWCNEFGILNGVGYDRIDPQGTVTRAQLAQILLNLDNLDK